MLRHDPTIRLLTERLVLRPTAPSDVERALEIRSNPAVARNLVSATIPPDTEKMTGWFRSHADEWREGSAYRFAIDLDGRMIGVCDVFDIVAGEGEIGYWIEQAAWGQGLRLLQGWFASLCKTSGLPQSKLVAPMTTLLLWRY